MNEIVVTLLNYKYKDKKMQKQVFIYKRTKKERIKDKAFNKLFYAYLEEQPVSVMGEVVLIEGKKYVELKRFQVDLERKLKMMEGELDGWEKVLQ